MSNAASKEQGWRCRITMNKQRRTMHEHPRNETTRSEWNVKMKPWLDVPSRRGESGRMTKRIEQPRGQSKAIERRRRRPGAGRWNEKDRAHEGVVFIREDELAVWHAYNVSSLTRETQCL